MAPHKKPAILRSPAMFMRLMVNGLSTLASIPDLRNPSRICWSFSPVNASRIWSPAAAMDFVSTADFKSSLSKSRSPVFSSASRMEGVETRSAKPSALASSSDF
jgi:hypothetical protein